MKTIGKRDVVLGLLKGLSDESLKPDEFTVEDFVLIAKGEGREISKQKAARHLNQMAASGLLGKRHACVNAKISNVYRRK